MDHTLLAAMTILVSQCPHLHKRATALSRQRKAKRAERKANQLWKCRHCGKRQNASLPAAAWTSPAQQQRDFPTFPQLLLLDKQMTKAKTKTGHFTCYESRTF